MPKVNPSCNRIRGGRLNAVDRFVTPARRKNKKSDSQLMSTTQGIRCPLKRRSSIATAGYTIDRPRLRRSPSAPSGGTRASKAELPTQSRLSDKAGTSQAGRRRGPPRINKVQMRKTTATTESEQPVARESTETRDESERRNQQSNSSDDIPTQSNPIATPPVNPRSSSMQRFYRSSFLAVRTGALDEAMRRPPAKKQYASLTLLTTRMNPKRKIPTGFPFVWPSFCMIPQPPTVNLWREVPSRSPSTKSSWSWRRLMPNWFSHSKSRMI